MTISASSDVTAEPGSGMTAEQRYLFDLHGFIVVRNALSPTTITDLLQFWNAKLTTKCLHDVSFDWGPAWRGLIDQDHTYPVIHELLGGRVRLDHAFTVDERFGNAHEHLHHHSDMFQAGIFYHASKGAMHNGLTGVIYSLREPTSTSPTFCAIPGSHKAAFSTPPSFFTISSCPAAHAIYVEPGDAIIFNEAVTHGTCLPEPDPTKRGPRRAIMVKYIPDCMAYRRPATSKPIAAIAPTPNYPHNGWEGTVDATLLTDRQRHIVAVPPFHRNRHDVT